jgi:hypothetical protein
VVHKLEKTRIRDGGGASKAKVHFRTGKEETADERPVVRITVSDAIPGQVEKWA